MVKRKEGRRRKKEQEGMVLLCAYFPHFAYSGMHGVKRRKYDMTYVLLSVANIWACAKLQ